eukprot:COSAG01_NODE_18066_length_1103_cov_0.671315_3_plen_94_part_01
MGVVILRLSNSKPPGEDILYGTPEAQILIERHRNAGVVQQDTPSPEGSLPITVSNGNIIFLECFAGSGSVGKVAEALDPKHRVISIDINAVTAG